MPYSRTTRRIISGDGSSFVVCVVFLALSVFFVAQGVLLILVVLEAAVFVFNRLHVYLDPGPGRDPQGSLGKAMSPSPSRAPFLPIDTLNPRRWAAELLAHDPHGVPGCTGGEGLDEDRLLPAFLPDAGPEADSAGA